VPEKASPPELPEWWVPGHSEHRAHGALTFGPDGATVWLVDHPLGFDGGHYDGPVLLGETQDEKLTLLHPFVAEHGHRTTQERSWFHAMVKSETLLRGAHIEDPDTATFDRADVRLAGLREMSLLEAVKPNGEIVKFVTPGLGARFIKLRGRGQLIFRHTEERDNDHPYRKSTEQIAEVTVYPKVSFTVADFDADWLRPLEALTILGARGPTALQRLSLTKTGRGEPDCIVKVESRAPALAEDPPDRYRPLLPLAALGDEAGRVIARWWQLYSDLGPSAGFLHAALSGEMYLEQKLLLGMSFVEAYHREIHGPKGNRTLRQRTEALIERTRETLPKVPALDMKLARDLAGTRNAIAHLDHRLSGKSLEGVDLIYGVQRLQLIIQVNLLLDLKLTKTFVRECATWSYHDGRQVPFVDLR
jgi:hypothetical protein